MGKPADKEWWTVQIRHKADSTYGTPGVWAYQTSTSLGRDKAEQLAGQFRAGVKARGGRWKRAPVEARVVPGFQTGAFGGRGKSAAEVEAEVAAATVKSGTTPDEIAGRKHAPTPATSPAITATSSAVDRVERTLHQHAAQVEALGAGESQAFLSLFADMRARILGRLATEAIGSKPFDAIRLRQVLAESEQAIAILRSKAAGTWDAGAARAVKLAVA